METKARGKRERQGKGVWRFVKERVSCAIVPLLSKNQRMPRDYIVLRTLSMLNPFSTFLLSIRSSITEMTPQIRQKSYQKRLLRLAAEPTILPT